MITIAQARIAKATGAPVIVAAEGAYKGTVEAVLAVGLNDDGTWYMETQSGERGPGYRRADQVEPSPELIEAAQSDEFDALGFREGEMSPEQKKIYEQAEDLFELLRQVVPNNTIHWAVEGARRALRDLSKQAGTILTCDRRPPAQDDEDERGYQGQMPAENQLLP